VIAALATRVASTHTAAAAGHLWADDRRRVELMVRGAATLDASNAAVVASPLATLAAATAWIAATQTVDHPLPPPAGHIGWLAPTLLAAIRIATSDCSESPRPAPDASAATAVVPTPARVAALAVLTNR